MLSPLGNQFPILTPLRSFLDDINKAKKIEDSLLPLIISETMSLIALVSAGWLIWVNSWAGLYALSGNADSTCVPLAQGSRPVVWWCFPDEPSVLSPGGLSTALNTHSVHCPCNNLPCHTSQKITWLSLRMFYIMIREKKIFVLLRLLPKIVWSHEVTSCQRPCRDRGHRATSCLSYTHFSLQVPLVS